MQIKDYQRQMLSIIHECKQIKIKIFIKKEDIL